MSNHPWIATLKEKRVIAVIRATDIELGYKMALAVASGGVQLIEITWNSAGAAQLISQLRTELPDCTIGTGTLLNISHVKEAIITGSQFLFTPHVDAQMIQLAVKMGVPMIPGALTPTEIITAWVSGAPCVKVFPVQAMGGASYIKSLQGPLGNIPLIPTGGVTMENAREFIQAGAIALGMSSQLFPAAKVASGNWDAISQQAKNLMQKMQG